MAYWGATSSATVASETSSTGAVPMTVDPSLKVTVPVGNGEPPPVTVTMSVGVWLTVVCSAVAVKLVVVAIWDPLTTCCSADAVVDPVKLGSPL